MLVAKLKALDGYGTGHMEYTVATLPGWAMSGVVEPETDSLLCNGAICPNTGKYLPLFNFLGSSYGAPGKLPTIIVGVQAVARGGSFYPTVGAVDGVRSVALDVEQITNHVQYWPFDDIYTGYAGGPINCGSTPPFDDGGYHTSYNSNTSFVGGGGAHNNMPPYVVVEGMLIHL